MTNEEKRRLDLFIEWRLKLNTDLISTEVYKKFLNEIVEYDQSCVEFNITNPIPRYSSNLEDSNKIYEWLLDNRFTVTHDRVNSSTRTILKRNSLVVHAIGDTVAESLALAIYELIY